MDMIFYDFRQERIPRSNLLHRRAMLKRMMDDSILTFMRREVSTCSQCAQISIKQTECWLNRFLVTTQMKFLDEKFSLLRIFKTVFQIIRIKQFQTWNCFMIVKLRKTLGNLLIVCGGKNKRRKQKRQFLFVYTNTDRLWSLLEIANTHVFFVCHINALSQSHSTEIYIYIHWNGYSNGYREHREHITNSHLSKFN